MNERLVKTMLGVGMMFRALHPDTDISAERTVIDNAVSAAAVSEDEKQLLDDVAAEGHVAETQSANETHDSRPRSAGVEEAARPPGKEPGDYADEQQKDLLHARKKQEEDDREKHDENLELGDREEVSGGNITAPAPPASGESAVTSEGRAPGTAADGEERAQTVGEADQERAEAAGEADQERAEAAVRADDESHEQAATEDEERLGRPAEESEPGDKTWVNDEAWVEDEAWIEDDDDVDDPDID